MSERDGGEIRLMLVAGEPSGDAHAASLARALRERAPEASFEFFGATGAEMRAAGVETVVRADDLSILGLLEIGRALPRFLSAYRELKRAATERRPDAVVLVDWPDFNLRLARALRRRGIRVVYYISPQLWAWRAWRLRQVRRDVDLLLAILPFEPAWYAARGVTNVEFVGHPLAGAAGARYGREEFCRRHGLDAARPVVALLPGSRRKEIQRILPGMLGAARALARSRPDAQFVVALAPNRTAREVCEALGATRDDPARARDDGAALLHDGPASPHEGASKANDVSSSPDVSSSSSGGASSSTDFSSLFAAPLVVVRDETREALAASDAAAVCSGTATLEAALAETPMAVVYRESFVNWHLLGSLIRVEHFGLVNLVAGRRLAPELMQNDFTPDALARELLQLLEPEHNARVRAQLRDAVSRLGAGGASSRAADAILGALRRWRQDA
ncbi:MAG TPA: lipid-A-disaccharide synthase [Pyrinomonadaceae bacterium]|nr:lipid-A-disaccharide synthase [Pyrinomonadaceae bacterium]